jgi:hypothetical protein
MNNDVFRGRLGRFVVVVIEVAVVVVVLVGVVVVVLVGVAMDREDILVAADALLLLSEVARIVLSSVKGKVSSPWLVARTDRR